MNRQSRRKIRPKEKARPITLAGLDLQNTTSYFLRADFFVVRFFAVFFDFGLLRALATFPSFCNRFAKV